MKKKAIITLCLLALGTTIFAYDMSVGFGGVFGLVKDKWENVSAPDHTRDFQFSQTQFGGFFFFGTRFTEFNFTVRYSNNDIKRKFYVREDMDLPVNIHDETLMLSVGGYGKYPFSLGTKIVLFPTLGVDFDAVDECLYLWGRGGIGLDVFFTERFFLRAQGLYGYGINIPVIGEESDITYTPGHGPLIKLGVGWMF